MFTIPRLIPDLQLEEYLKFIRSKHYSIFIVDGKLPSCLADEKLGHQPVDQGKYLSLSSRLPFLCIDEKLARSTECSAKHGNLMVRLPQDVIKRYQKNPNDPEVLALIRAQLPEGILGQLDSGLIEIRLDPRSESKLEPEIKKDSHPEHVPQSAKPVPHVPESEAFLQQAIAQSLRDEQERKIRQDAALRETHTEKLNELLLDETIAESLASTDVSKEPPAETHQSIPVTNNSTPTTPKATSPTVRKVIEVPPPMADRSFWPSYEGKIRRDAPGQSRSKY